MSYNGVVKGGQLIRRLKKHGVQIAKGRGKGGHQLATFKGRQTTIPMHGDADLGPGFVRLICKQLGIDPDAIL